MKTHIRKSILLSLGVLSLVQSTASAQVSETIASAETTGIYSKAERSAYVPVVEKVVSPTSKPVEAIVYPEEELSKKFVITVNNTGENSKVLVIVRGLSSDVFYRDIITEKGVLRKTYDMSELEKGTYQIEIINEAVKTVKHVIIR